MHNVKRQAIAAIAVLAMLFSMLAAPKQAEAALRPDYYRLDADWSVLSMTRSQAYRFADALESSAGQVQFAGALAGIVAVNYGTALGIASVLAAFSRNIIAW